MTTNTTPQTRTEELKFYFPKSLEEKSIEIHKNTIQERWPEARFNDEGFTLPLDRPTMVDYCMLTYFVRTLKTGKKSRKESNWETRFTLPMCVVSRIEHGGEVYSPNHALFG